jgi:DDE superfamily endonuclease
MPDVRHAAPSTAGTRAGWFVLHLFVAVAPPAGWSPDGHRLKAPLTYRRGPEKTWIHGGVRIGDGQAITLCAPLRNGAHWQEFLTRLEQANPTGAIAVITDNLSSHHSLATRAWLTGIRGSSRSSSPRAPAG